MKKLLMFCLVILLAGGPSLNVNAAEPISSEVDLIKEPLFAINVETGELVQPTDIQESYVMSINQDYITVSRTITYQGEVTPAATIGYTNIIGDSTYTGTLYLQYYIYRNNQTTAYYEGTIYLQGSTS